MLQRAYMAAKHPQHLPLTAQKQRQTHRGAHLPSQIRFMLLLSRQGKVRLSKWYTTVNQKERAKIIRELTPMVLGRPLKLCNFLDWKDSKVSGLSSMASSCICHGGVGVRRP